MPEIQPYYSPQSPSYNNQSPLYLKTPTIQTKISQNQFSTTIPKTKRYIKIKNSITEVKEKIEKLEKLGYIGEIVCLEDERLADLKEELKNIEKLEEQNNEIQNKSKQFLAEVKAGIKNISLIDRREKDIKNAFYITNDLKLLKRLMKWKNKRGKSIFWQSADFMTAFGNHIKNKNKECMDYLITNTKYTIFHTVLNTYYYLDSTSQDMREYLLSKCSINDRHLLTIPNQEAKSSIWKIW